MKKKLISLLSCCLVGLLSVHAESCLVIQLRDGHQQSYVLSEQPVLTFNNGLLMLKSQYAEATFELINIENYHFSDTENSIRTVKDDEQRFTYVDGIITVEGTQEQVALSNLAGKFLHVSHKGESFAFDLNGQPQGTYLLRIGQQTIKLYHKQ